MRVIGSVVLLFALGGRASAQPQIEVGGVRGGSVYSLARSPTNPQQLFAGTSGSGLFVSNDGGATWTVSTLPEVAEHTVLGIGFGAGAERVLCGDAGGLGLSPILHSTDSGATWTRTEFPETYAFCVTLAAGNAEGTWYAGVVTGAANGGKLYRSTDGGLTWTATGLSLTGEAPSAILELAGGRILVGTRAAEQGGGHLSGYTGGLHYSDDGGTTWNAVGSITNATLGLAQNGTGTVMGAFYDGSNDASVQTSSDGSTWTPLQTITNASANDQSEGQVTYHAGSDTFFVVAEEQVLQSGTGPGYSIASSSDLADSAETGLLSFSHHSRVDVDPADASRILLGDRGGDAMLITTNGGASWDFSNEGFHAQSIELAVKHPSTGYRYAANSLGYVYFSDGDFSAFKKIFRIGGQGGAEYPSVYGLAFDRNDPARVLIAGERQSDSTPHLRLLPDAVGAPEDAFPFTHAAWTDITPPGGANTVINAVLVDGSNLTVGLAPLNNSLTDTYLYRSTNTGASWNPLPLTIKGGVRSLSWGASAQEIYAGSGDGGNGQSGTIPSSGNGLFKSTDGGTSWTALTSNAELANEGVLKIAVDPANPLRIWVLSTVPGGSGASPTHVYESLDGGATLTAITPNNFGPNGEQNNDATAFDLAYIAVEDKVVISTGGGINGYMYSPGSNDRYWQPAFATYGSARTLYSGSVGAGGSGGLFEITGLGLSEGDDDDDDGGGKGGGCGCDLGGGLPIGAGALIAAFPLCLALQRRRRE